MEEKELDIIGYSNEIKSPARPKRRISMIVLVAASTLLFSVLGVQGYESTYADYALDVAKEPFLKNVFVAAHDEVYPWGRVIQAPVETAQAAEETTEQLQGLVDVLSAEDATVPVVSGEMTHTAAAGREDTAADAQAQQAIAEAQKAAAENAARLAAHEASLASTPETAAPVTSIPLTVCDPVMPATDYGVVDTRFMAPIDTVFSYATEGDFAPTGEFYPLGEAEDIYFADALFIGDSRTDGLYDYGGLKGKASFAAKDAMSVYKLFDAQLPFHAMTGEEAPLTLSDLLQNIPFKKIYISVGINELGMPETMRFLNTYRATIEQIRAWQPQAIIYIQGIMHVTKERSEKDKIFNNTLIVQRNAAIASLANGRDIFYIDPNPAVCDEEGNLRAELSTDQVHLKAVAYDLWTEYIRTHVALGASEARLARIERGEIPAFQTAAERAAKNAAAEEVLLQE